MNKFFTLIGALALCGFSAAAEVPAGLEVSPANNETVESLSKISIEYTLGWYGGIDSYRTPNVQINGVPVNVTYSVSGDVLTYTLENPITRSGEYEIFIGANSFYYDEIMEYDNPDMSWLVKVSGGSEPGGFQPIVNPGIDVIPAQGCYSSLQYFTLVIDESLVAANGTKECYLMRDDDTQQIVATGSPKDGAGLIYGCVDLERKVTEPGTYLLVVPEGAFYNMMSDDDYPACSFRFEIAADGESPLPEPDKVYFDPDPSNEVAQLSTIIVEYPDAVSLYPNNNSTQLGDVTLTDDEGNVVASVRVDNGLPGLSGNEASITFTPAVTAEGSYTLHIPARTFVIEGGALYDGTYSTEQTVVYTVNPLVGVGEIGTEAASCAKEIYRIDGTRVAGGEKLPAGFYIIDGKKVMVK